MRDEQCVRFLQWALPQLHMRWPGFRKVRNQVCKRVDRHIRTLCLADVEEYQAYLQAHADEWAQLDSLCRITVSRFNRDRAVFTALGQDVLPSLIPAVRARGDNTLRIWSAGCGSGEEPYTLSILWNTDLRFRFPDTTIDIVATDSDAGMIRRATDARYKFGSLKDLPERSRAQAFSREDDVYCLEPDYRHDVTFLEQDIRRNQPDGRFDLVLCRNLVFTYFDYDLQLRILNRIVSSMYAGAALVLGIHEQLPPGALGLSVSFDKERIYRKDM